MCWREYRVISSNVMAVFLIRKWSNSCRGNTLHYLLHGCHHKHPMDGYRLVFPPTFATMFAIPVSASPWDSKYSSNIITSHHMFWFELALRSYCWQSPSWVFDKSIVFFTSYTAWLISCFQELGLHQSLDLVYLDMLCMMSHITLFTMVLQQMILLGIWRYADYTFDALFTRLCSNSMFNRW